MADYNHNKNFFQKRKDSEAMANVLKYIGRKTAGYFFGAIFFCAFAYSPAQASVSSITIDANTGDIISSSAADKLRYPASLTKLMTLYITFDALEKGLIKLDDQLPVSWQAANRSPSRLGLKPGSTISVKTCIEALIVKSANDCASVLAESLGYTEADFAKTMTKVARALGMKNTTFKNASGLPNRLQKTTARDMAILAAAVYHHFPQYYKWFSLKKFSYNGQTYYTHNHILKTFEGADGMKTGFTNAAGFNIITSAERNGQRVIAVTMGHRTLKDRDAKVAKMMEKGLTVLAMNSKAKESSMYASLDAPDVTEGEIEIASAETDSNSPADDDNENTGIEQGSADPSVQLSTPEKTSWSIQVGAFSNYTKARNYALKVRENKLRKFTDINIEIEPFEAGSAIVYRSRITGFEQSDAQTACKHLKKSKMSCIVVKNDSSAPEDSLMLATR